MLNSPVLDLAIALSFTYFLLGLIVSTIHESILTATKSRNNLLKEAINNLFFDADWKGGLAKDLTDNAFITSLKRDQESETFPAYIPSRNFALALLDILKKDDPSPLTTEYVRGLLSSDHSPIKGEAKKIMLAILDESGTDFNRFVEGLQKFFDDAMDRVTGWYKTKYKGILFLISFVITAILNVDSVNIVTSLWADKDKLASMAGAISEDFKASSNVNDGNYIFKNDAGDTLAFFKIDTDTSFIKADTTQKVTPGSISRNVNVKLTQAGIPIGWTKNNYPTQSCCSDLLGFIWVWLKKIIGWLVTSFALYLGAPFWFDLLNKFVNIRGVGKKPGPQPEPHSKKSYPVG